MLLNAGDIVLDALLQKHKPKEAVALARRWYRAAVALLKALPSSSMTSAVKDQRDKISRDLEAIVSLELGDSQLCANPRAHLNPTGHEEGEP